MTNLRVGDTAGLIIATENHPHGASLRVQVIGFEGDYALIRHDDENCTEGRVPARMLWVQPADEQLRGLVGSLRRLFGPS